MSIRQQIRIAARRCVALIVTAMAVLATGGVIAPAAVASPLDGGTFHEEFTDVLNDFCGEPGLTVTEDVVVDGRFLLNTRKPGTPPYGFDVRKETAVLTNEGGESITVVIGALSQDLKVTDNGDGTVTILVLATGPFTAYDDSTGKAIARNPGQVRYEILIDLSGTPSDPSDDQFIDFLGEVKGSTGRNDDYCAAALDVLG